MGVCRALFRKVFIKQAFPISQTGEFRFDY